MSIIDFNVNLCFLVGKFLKIFKILSKVLPDLDEKVTGLICWNLFDLYFGPARKKLEIKTSYVQGVLKESFGIVVHNPPGSMNDVLSIKISFEFTHIFVNSY